MAATPKYKIFRPDGEYVAACKYAEDAAALVALMGEGSTIRTGHRKSDIVWTEGVTGEAGESYDAAAHVIFGVEEERYAAGRAALAAANSKYSN